MDPAPEVAATPLANDGRKRPREDGGGSGAEVPPPQKQKVTRRDLPKCALRFRIDHECLCVIWLLSLC